MNTKQVSVILPAYNSSSLIAAAIDSALTQTYANTEIIVVDDGSTDKTGQIVKKCGDRIKYVFQENSGPAKARNTGVSHAQGEYIAFLDADDTWFADKIAKQVETLEKFPSADLVFTDMKRVRNGVIDQKSWVQIMRSYNAILSRNCYLERPWEMILEENFIPTCSVLARRSCFERFGGFREDLLMGEDWDLWLRFSLGCSFYFIPEPLGAITRDKDMGSYDWGTYFSCFISLLQDFARDHADLMRDSGIDLDRKLAPLYFELGYYHYMQSRFGKAREFLIQSMRRKFSFKAFRCYVRSLLSGRGRWNPEDRKGT